jgi:hypothetical protein
LNPRLHGKRPATHIKIIARAHLDFDLSLTPSLDPRVPLRVEPTILSDGADDPALLALLRENVPEAGAETVRMQISSL